MDSLLSQLVVIDGMNVAKDKSWRPVGGSVPHGSALPVVEAMSYFLARGYEVHTFLPAWAIDGESPGCPLAHP